MFFVSYIYRSARLSDIYIIKLKCNTCNNVYVGQSGRYTNVRHKEYIRYIRTNNPLSAHALHILQSGHEYGTITDTLQLLKTCKKGIRMNCWETLYRVSQEEWIKFREGVPCVNLYRYNPKTPISKVERLRR